MEQIEQNNKRNGYWSGLLSGLLLAILLIGCIYIGNQVYRIFEAKKIAELIDPQQVERYTLMLKKLQKGQSIVTGQVTIGGCENDKPIIIKSEYGSNRAPILNPQQVLTDKKSV